MNTGLIVGVLMTSCLLSANAQSPATYFKQHISVLAHDSLEGRLAGSLGERKAMRYITKQWEEMGYEVHTQKVPIIKDRKPSKKSYVKIGKENVKWQLIRWSGEGKAQGTIKWLSCDEETDTTLNLEGRIPVMQECDFDPHHGPTFFERLSTLKRRGAQAIIIHPEAISKRDTNTAYTFQWYSIPIITIPTIDSTYDGKTVKVNVDIEIDSTYGYNVYVVDECEVNCSGKTVVVSAHYDHLGNGIIGSRGAKGEIHNGADDNASGVAMLLELSRKFKEIKYNKHNYLFVAFTAEEMGLVGSKHFVEDPPYDLATTLANVNLDMVGRLDTLLQFLGAGSSSKWDKILSVLEKRHQKVTKFKWGGSGMGPSDHASFYKKRIPVVHVFTGLHEDYHKPSDDADKINYHGMEITYIILTDLLAALDTTSEMDYIEVKEEQTAMRFKVTLGILPDYTFSGKGLKIDGVVKGKPAEKAGLQAGDIIIKLGDYEIDNIYSYMEALSHFKKGDRTTITVLRNGQEITKTVEF